MSHAGWAWLVTELLSNIATEHMAGWLVMRSRHPREGMQAFAEEVIDGFKSSSFAAITAKQVHLTYSMALHDAIMLYAHAATKVLSEGGDLHDGRAVTAAVRSTTIKGVGGSVVALDQSGDRNESYEVMNYMAGNKDRSYGAKTFLYTGLDQKLHVRMRTCTHGSTCT